jgi:hypothetical protein
MRLPAPDPIDGEYEVILPTPPVRWSFWADDLPVLVNAAVAIATAVVVSGWAQRLFS